ncbi:MAG: hypothetical protein PWQ97_888 [Tepidanaerobacteraceae bacterium]|nr:hypothetical protein [Tepidanaerobacteraceae bacterium]
MYGVDLDADDNEVDIEKLAEIILQAWEEEEQVFTKSSEELMETIGKILRNKPGMKSVRIPGFMLTEMDIDAGDDEMEAIM